MTRVKLTNATHALHGLGVADRAAKRITGIGRIDHQAASANNFDRAPDETLVRVPGVNLKILHDA